MTFSRATSVAVVVSILVAAGGLALSLCREELGLAAGWETIGDALCYLGVASCAATWWVHRRYADWRADGVRPAGRPALNEESRSQPLWLIAASMIVPYPAAGTGLLALTVFTDLFLEGDVVARNPAKLLVELLALALTAGYVLAAVTKRQRANEAGLLDLVGSAVALAALGLAAVYLAPRLSGGPVASPPGLLTGICLIATTGTAAMALVFARRFQPRDKWGRAESTPWTYRRRKHV